MKKIYVTLVAVFAIAQFSYGQGWTTSGGNTTTNDNVGIGTTTPGAKLDVNGTGSFSGALTGTTLSLNGPNSLLNLTNSGAGAVFSTFTNAAGAYQIGADNSGGSISGGVSYALVMNAPSGRPIVLAANNAPLMTVLSTGNVGIGATAPTAKLQLGSIDNGTTPDLQFTYDGASYRNGIFNVFNSGSVAANKMKFFVSDSSPTGKTTVMTLQGDGNVGIGTMSPGAKLEIDGSPSTDANLAKFSGADPNGNLFAEVATTGSGGAILRLTGGSTFGLQSSGYGSGVGNNKLSFFTGNTVLATLLTSGNFGIGTTSPIVPLHVAQYGNNVTGDLTLLTKFTDPTGIKGISLGYNQSSQGGIIYSENNTGTGSPLEFWTYNGSSFAPRMVFAQDGNLLIGKTSQTNSAYKLDINGSARANEIVVNTTGADFVFDHQYKLPKLSEVKTYIDDNHHLPEIPSAEDMKKDGLNVGEINIKLLQKVEELTLYSIEQNKQITEQNEQMTEQNKEVTQQNKQIVNQQKQITSQQQQLDLLKEEIRDLKKNYSQKN